MSERDDLIERLLKLHRETDIYELAEAADALSRTPDVEAVIEACAKIAEQNPDSLESAGGPGSGKFKAMSRVAIAIRSLDRSQFNAAKGGEAYRPESILSGHDSTTGAAHPKHAEDHAAPGAASSAESLQKDSGCPVAAPEPAAAQELQPSGQGRGVGETLKSQAATTPVSATAPVNPSPHEGSAFEMPEEPTLALAIVLCRWKACRDCNQIISYHKALRSRLDAALAAVKDSRPWLNTWKDYREKHADIIALAAQGKEKP